MSYIANGIRDLWYFFTGSPDLIEIFLSILIFFALYSVFLHGMKKTSMESRFGKKSLVLLSVILASSPFVWLIYSGYRVLELFRSVILTIMLVALAIGGLVWIYNQFKEHFSVRLFTISAILFIIGSLPTIFESNGFGNIFYYGLFNNTYFKLANFLEILREIGGIAIVISTGFLIYDFVFKKISGKMKNPASKAIDGAKDIQTLAGDNRALQGTGARLKDVSQSRDDLERAH